MSDRLAAIERSFLAGLPAADREAIVAGALAVDVPAGSVLYREDDPARVVLVVDGLARVYLRSSTGREVTIRYARAGDVLGLPTTIVRPIPVGVQVLTDTSLLILDGARIRQLGVTNAAVAWALAEEVSHRVIDLVAAFSGAVFGSIRQRLARHLLDIAAERQQGARLVVRVSQQDLADAVGTAREVVARTLHELRAEGLVETGRAGIVLLDPAGLDAVATSGEV